MRLRAVLFDLDNTLIDRDAAVRRLFHQRLPAQWWGTALRLDGSGRRGMQGLFRWLDARLLLGGSAAACAWFQAGLLAQLRPCPAVRGLLQRVQARWATALVSNGGPVQRRKLARAGLRFPQVCISSELGCAKPDPGLFLHALRRLGCAPDEALMLGDHPEHDIAAAQRLGLRTCWISHGARFPAGLPEPDSILEDILGLGELLAC